MEVAETVAQVRNWLTPVRRAGRSVGFVPTMGALHDGHWSLVDRARRETDAVAVSIFVNPLQFGPREDFRQYPRPREADLAGCRSRGVGLVFYPAVVEMYPDPSRTRVQMEQLGAVLCGRSRPGHFDGVCTVVCKLFNIVQADKAYFGEKDYQQLVIIRQMVRDLNMPVEIVACPTVREADGLALSSRNTYLPADQRRRAVAISAALREAAAGVAAGERDASRVIAAISSRIQDAGAASVDYVSVVHPDTLEDLPVIGRPARICVAARFGTTRLIDNIAAVPPAAQG